ncbi:hypothetical protein [Microcoleus sp. FACHB-672]|uniref:hypothetical protein n=1 Tax=Microcoleus sp. FACHB-672 TaxID=2692825 RepID=UPI0016862DEA|nr:hypothetical protein [Microcoleus sp. FACHB-672]MBD2042497.1 hypothetical protein [Microcoleus sp. FACHB-672]
MEKRPDPVKNPDKYKYSVEKPGTFPTGFPQAEPASKICRQSVSQVFPQFPQPLRLLFINSFLISRFIRTGIQLDC